MTTFSSHRPQPVGVRTSTEQLEQRIDCSHYVLPGRPSDCVRAPSVIHESDLNSRPAVHELNLRRTATLFGEVVDDRLEFVEASEGGVAIKCG